MKMLNAFGNLKTAHDEFVYFISSMDIAFQISFEKISVENKVLIIHNIQII